MNSDLATQSETSLQNPESGQAVAKQNMLGHLPKTNGSVRRHAPPTHKDYWKPRLEHRSYTRDGQRVELAEYSVRLQHLGQRVGFNLDSSNAEVAADKAKEIYIFLKANGWDATLAKYKPQPIAQNKLTIGEFLSAVRETGKLEVRTFLNYSNCFRSILAGMFGIKDTKAKFDYRNGGNQKWRERIDSIRLEKLTPHLVERWMKKFVAGAGTSPADIASARRTANSYVRCSRSLFSAQLLREPSVQRLTLPNPLPFAGVELFDAGSSKYISKIDARVLIAAALRELKPKDPEAYKVFLLGLFAGMRKAEIDLCEWGMVDWGRKVIKLEETQWLRLKSADSAGEITVDSQVLAELKAFKASGDSPFVVSSKVTWGSDEKPRVSVRPPRPGSARPYYRCEPVFERLNEWLRSKGITANKPLHELRKEIGALIATEHGIFAAQKYLRHTDITTTARHYADHKARISVGLGKYLQTRKAQSQGCCSVKPRRKRGRSTPVRNRQTSIRHSPKGGENGHRAASGDFDEAAYFQQVKEELQARITAAAKPATDEQLAQVWPPWNALPATVQPEERKWILTGFGIEGNAQRRQRFEQLREQFNYLPLDSNVYNDALYAAITWTKLCAYFNGTTANHAGLIQRQWAFREADAHNSARIAVVRAAREIQITNPGLLESTTPTLAEIKLLQNRYDKYRHAREQALDAIASLIYKVPGIRTGRPLPLEQQALGVPNPPEDVPRHLYIARLDALGICSSARLAEFMQEESPLLSPDEQRQFQQMSRKPQFGKEPYAAFLVWVHDNMPVFTQFRWLLKDIRDAAQTFRLDCPSAPSKREDALLGLKQWMHKNGLSGLLKRGSPGSYPEGFEQSKALLSPAPAFGDVLRKP